MPDAFGIGGMDADNRTVLSIDENGLGVVGGGNLFKVGVGKEGAVTGISFVDSFYGCVMKFTGDVDLGGLQAINQRAGGLMVNDGAGINGIKGDSFVAGY